MSLVEYTKQFSLDKNYAVLVEYEDGIRKAKYDMTLSEAQSYRRKISMKIDKTHGRVASVTLSTNDNINREMMKSMMSHLK